MKKILLVIFLIFGFSGGFVVFKFIKDEPQGQWEAIEDVQVYKHPSDVIEESFLIKKGQICAIGERWHGDKMLFFRKVICEGRSGWILNPGKLKEKP